MALLDILGDGNSLVFVSSGDVEQSSLPQRYLKQGTLIGGLKISNLIMFITKRTVLD